MRLPAASGRPGSISVMPYVSGRSASDVPRPCAVMSLSMPEQESILGYSSRTPRTGSRQSIRHIMPEPDIGTGRCIPDGGPGHPCSSRSITVVAFFLQRQRKAMLMAWHWPEVIHWCYAGISTLTWESGCGVA